MKSRHEPVSLPEGQPERLETQPCPDCFSRSRASRSSSLGRGVGLVFLSCAPSFSSLFFRFSVLVSWSCLEAGGGAVASPAIRGVSRGGCVASPRSGKVLSQLERAVAPRAQGADPRTAHPSGIPLQYRCTFFWWDIYVLGLRFLAPPAVTSASEVLTQTCRSLVRVVRFP